MRMTVSEIQRRKREWKSRPEVKRVQAKFGAWTSRLQGVIFGPLIARVKELLGDRFKA